MVRCQFGQQWRSLCCVEENGFTADLDARCQPRQIGVLESQCTLPVHLDDIGLQVLADQCARCPFCNLPAMIQHDQAVAQALGFVHEMGGQEDGLALLEQLLHAFPHQVAGLRVQAGGGFVQQQQCGLVDERTCQRQSPLHAAGEFARFGLRFVRQRRKVQQAGDACFQFGIWQTEVTAINQQVFGARKIGVQRVELAHHTQMGFDGQRIGGQGQPAARLRSCAG